MNLAASLPPVPFAPGESPFLAKGVVWLAAQKTMETRVPGGVAAVCEARPEYRQFLTQIFVASGQYDILPIAELAPAAAKLAGTSVEEYVKTSGKRAAEAWMRGIHKTLLQQDSPVELCKRFASVMRQLYNFGHPEIQSINDNSVDVLTSDLPEPIVWWWQTSCKGYVERLVQAAGGKNGGIRFGDLHRGMVREGVQMVAVPNTTYWD